MKKELTLILLSLLFMIICISPLSANEVDNGLINDNGSIIDDSNNILSDNNTTSKSIKEDTANTFYVTTDGNSYNTGTEESSPWDITTALTNMQEYNNSVVYISSGVYEVNETTLINSSITGYNTILIGIGNVEITGTDTILNISSDNQVTIENIYFRDIITEHDGSVIYNDGKLIINNCSFVNNSALFSKGGVIYNNADLIITNSVLNNNTATYGGVIYNNQAKVSLKNNSFRNNQLTNGLSGGVIYNLNGYVELISNIFDNNTCNFNGGGVIFNSGNSTLINNTISNSYGLHGGAIYNNGTINVTNNTFINNTAYIGSVLYSTSTAYLDENIIRDSKADSSGGAIYNMGYMSINNTTITNNTATTGGAIYNALGTISITNSIINNNSANTAGAIYNHQNIYIENTTISNNYANNTGGIVNEYEVLEHYMDTVSFVLYFKGNITVINSSFINNYNTDSSSQLASEIHNNGYMYLEGNTFTGNNNDDNTILIYNNESCYLSEEDETIYGGVLILNNNTIENTNKQIVNYGNITLENNMIINMTRGVLTNNNNLFMNNNTLKNNQNINNNYIITNNNANNIIIVNNTFINNTYDNQDILFSPINNYTLITNNTYTANNLETTITGPNNSTGIINIELNTHEYYNTTINTGWILVYDQNNKVIEEYVITDGKISINLSKDLIKSNEYVTITYNSSDDSYQNNSIIVYLAQLIDTYITIDEVNAQVGDTITLRATIKDENNNLVTGGNAVFKINGVSLKSDGSFNSNASVLKLSVNNGVVTYTISADSYLLSANNITLTYSGSSNYYSSSNTTNNISINKKNAQITINSSTAQARINDTITFTITVTDTSNLPINNGYIILKINDITIRDANNNTLKIQVINNTATYNYTIPTGSGATNSKGETINYNLTVKYISDEYETISNTTTYNVLRTDTKIVVDNIEITNKSMNITARITDTNNNTVTGTNKICIKINGKTLRDSNNNVLYFTIVDGVINLNNITVNSSYITNITIVTGQRCCYTASRVTITNP